MKNFKLNAEEIIRLIPPMGGCIATDRITVEGLPVVYMYRNEPINEMDTGWQFFSGTESDDYVNNTDNIAIYDVNTIANYDRAIIPYLNQPIGADLQRIPGTDEFEMIPG
nr:DUF2185 domain-containing protein [uncultured Mucilaginibacter sp.]